MDSPTITLIHILRQRVDELVAQGDLEEALHAATAAVEKAQQALSSDLESIDEFASALEVRAELLRQLGRLEAARDDYKQAADQLENRPDRLLQRGRIAAGHGAVHDEMGHGERACELWEQAIQCFEAANPPAVRDVAALSNNLAYLKRAAGNFEAAEGYFLKALEILHREMGQEHEETAAVSNNLGALYHASGFHEQAREMHLMALESRRKALGEEHPDTAQSHNNLALALVETGDLSLARRHFEKSMESFRALGPEYEPDLEAVEENFRIFLQVAGEEESEEPEGEVSVAP